MRDESQAPPRRISASGESLSGLSEDWARPEAATLQTFYKSRRHYEELYQITEGFELRETRLPWQRYVSGVGNLISSRTLFGVSDKHSANYAA
jgi:hypothetical protein